RITRIKSHVCPKQRVLPWIRGTVTEVVHALLHPCYPCDPWCAFRVGAERLLEILAKTASTDQTPLSGRDRLFIAIDTDAGGPERQAAAINGPAVSRIGFHPQMRQHLMAATTLPLRAQRGQID